MAYFDCFYQSEKLNRKNAFRVVIPEDVSANVAPVVYLLHGLDGTYLSWFDNTDLEGAARRAGCVVVLPDAGNSFYTGAYLDMIATELIPYVEKTFNLTGPRHIAGVSMGGHGAYKIAFLNRNLFETAGSFSGVLDLNAPINDAIDKRARACMEAVFGKDFDLKGTNEDLFHLVYHSKPMRLYQFCGKEDFLYNVNLSFRRHANIAKMDVDYFEAEGDHTWPTWARQIDHYLNWVKERQLWYTQKSN